MFVQVQALQQRVPGPSLSQPQGQAETKGHRQPLHLPRPLMEARFLPLKVEEASVLPSHPLSPLSEYSVSAVRRETTAKTSLFWPKILCLPLLI